MRLYCGEGNDASLAGGTRKIPAASPTPIVIWRFAALSCGRYRSQYRPLIDHYRPLSKIPPADRPPGNETFCGAFSFPLVIAVGSTSPVATADYPARPAPAVPFGLLRASCASVPSSHKPCTARGSLFPPAPRSRALCARTLSVPMASCSLGLSSAR